MEWPEIKAKLDRAKEQFLNKDRDLLEVDANERSMTHKFAEYLQQEFRDDWNVDCEYNRHGEDTKRLQWVVGQHVSTADEHGRTVFPDIIVHHRRKRENLLVIEAKKSGNPYDTDRLKLEAFMRDEQYKYTFAVLLRFVTDKPFDIEIERVEG